MQYSVDTRLVAVKHTPTVKEREVPINFSGAPTPLWQPPGAPSAQGAHSGLPAGSVRDLCAGAAGWSLWGADQAAEGCRLGCGGPGGAPGGPGVPAQPEDASLRGAASRCPRAGKLDGGPQLGGAVWGRCCGRAECTAAGTEPGGVWEDPQLGSCSLRGWRRPTHCLQQVSWGSRKARQPDANPTQHGLVGLLCTRAGPSTLLQAAEGWEVRRCLLWARAANLGATGSRCSQGPRFACIGTVRHLDALC